jgi:hypothetical protein
MRSETLYCHARGANVNRVVDFEGVVDHLICPQYRRADGTCGVKRTEGTGGPLSRLLQRVGGDIAADPTITRSLR